MNEGQVKSGAAVSAASPPGICCESQVQQKEFCIVWLYH